MTSPYTTQQLARKAGTSDVTIRRLCKSGKIKATKHGRAWLIKREDGDAWLKTKEL